MGLSAKSEAVAFRIWQFCTPKEWDVTPQEIAEAIEANVKVVGRILQHKGWGNRVRAGSRAIHQSARHDAPFLVNYTGCY